MTGDILFEVFTPLGFYVRTTESYWQYITTVKHPVMHGKQADVAAVLRSPAQIRRSRLDTSVYLFYGLMSHKRALCAVVKRLNGDGFLITTYPTDTIKEGALIWTN